jgi:cyclophilin family peptidyl-prolyl cis-trans isomerase
MKNTIIIISVLAVSVFLSACGGGPRKAVVETEYGNMVIELSDETPQHRDNFVKLVEEGFYDDLLFHRVIQNFMIQGGDPDSKGAPAGQPLGAGGPGYTIPAEITPALIHKKGALSAARQGDAVNPQKASSGSQFYVVQGKIVSDQELDAHQQRKGFTYTPEQREAYKTIGGAYFLDQDYTVFGQVVEGLDVIDKIAAVQCNPQARPVQDVKMKVRMLN